MSWAHSTTASAMFRRSWPGRVEGWVGWVMAAGVGGALVEARASDGLAEARASGGLTAESVRRIAAAGLTESEDEDMVPSWNCAGSAPGQHVGAAGQARVIGLPGGWLGEASGAS
jgi:hypothetical protein